MYIKYRNSGIGKWLRKIAQEEAECSCPKKEGTYGGEKNVWRTEGKENMSSFPWHKQQEIWHHMTLGFRIRLTHSQSGMWIE